MFFSFRLKFTGEKCLNLWPDLNFEKVLVANLLISENGK